MDLYRLKLRPASYKGIRFEVRESGSTAGRRTIVHEYPRRDTPYVEDLGRAVREYSMTAYICGVDYIDRTKKLMQALESEGAGKLVHPWLGDVSVVPIDVGTVNFSDRLGLATVSLVFVEAGELTNPSGKSNWLKRLRQSVDSLMSDAADEFARMIHLDGVQDFVVEAADEAWETARAVLCNDTFLTSLGVAHKVMTIPTALMSVNPKGFATSVISATGVSSFVGTFSGWRDMSVNLCDITRSKALEYQPTDTMVVESSDKLIAQNTNAINDLVKTVAVANAAGAASLIGSEYDTETPLSYDELIAIRDTLLDSLDYQAVYTSSDVVSAALEDVRSDAFFDLTERARDNARLITLDTPAGMPLLVAAYEKYGDAERCDDLVRMNNVPRPGFAPYGGLKALSR